MELRRISLYGIRDVTLDYACLKLEKSLGVKFEKKKDNHYGGTYYRCRMSHGRNIKLFNNFDKTNGKWMIKQPKNYSVLISTTSQSDMDDMYDSLAESVRPTDLLSFTLINE